MRSKQNFTRMGGMALLVVLALNCAGCGGISASKTVSPATFLLPGILRNDPPANCTNALATADFKLIDDQNAPQVASTR